ncbi:MAG: DPP IV N-terminal domain-containing protein [Bacteroidetes bacterium]|nr:DPP IV N-terminal domain-containing protein [Bacteroidota bacterium]MDA1223633.1 DPP IV N-terminal domain-containing protein [Bacteroidota bacterium]
MNSRSRLISQTSCFLLFLGSAISSSWAQSTTPSNTLTLESIFKDPSLYPKPGNFGKFAPDGKHFIELKLEEPQPSDKKTSNSPIAWSLIKKDIEGKSNTPIVLFDAHWFDKTPPQGSYKISSDEKFMVVQYEMQQVYRHSFTAKCYVVDLQNHKITYIPERMRYPTLSPDNKRIAYVKNNNVFIYDLLAAKETQITTDGKENKIINGAVDWVYEEEFTMDNGMRWSPSGNFLAFYHFNESKVKEFSMDMFNSKELYPSQTHWKYPKAGEDNAKVDVHIYSLNDNQTRIAKTNSERDQYLPRIQWTQTDQFLSIQRLNRWQNHWELLFCNPLNGDCNLILEEVDSAYVEITDNLTFIPKTTQFIYSSEKSGFNHLYLHDYSECIEKGNVSPNCAATQRYSKALTAGNFDVIRFLGYVDATKSIVYSSSEQSMIDDHVYCIGLNGKGKKRLTEPGFNYNVSLGPNAIYYTESRSNNSNLPIVEHRIKRMDGKLSKDVELNSAWSEKMKSLNLGQVKFDEYATDSSVTGYWKTEFWHLAAQNGWDAKTAIAQYEIHQQLLNKQITYTIYPPNFDARKKYPVLMFVYGGPGRNQVRNQFGSRNYFYHQYLAAQGYLISVVDNRGTGRKGAIFKKSTYLELGLLESTDHAYAAKQMAKLPYVDASRIGIWGWSFGGYMSSSAITKHSDVFKAAVAVAPVTHWKFYDNIYTERYLRRPIDNPLGYENNSPLNFTDGIKGNYLLVHGTGDDNVHWQNSAEMINAMIKSGAKYDSEVYPNRNHGIGDRAASFHLYRRMTNFILEKL